MKIQRAAAAFFLASLILNAYYNKVLNSTHLFFNPIMLFIPIVCNIWMIEKATSTRLSAGINFVELCIPGVYLFSGYYYALHKNSQPIFDLNVVFA